MSQKKQFIKGGMWLTLGYGVSALFSFARNIILARLVSVEDFGIASIFAVSMSLLEMISNISVDKLLVQTNASNLEKLQATGHALQFIRGCFSASILYLLAGPLSNIFNIPHAIHAFEWLSLVPLIRGFAHLDIQVQQRSLMFKNVAISEIAPQVVALITLGVVAVWQKNFMLIVWVLLLQNLSFVFITFYLADKRYVWHWDRGLLLQIVRFGWPLLANGFLMFIIMQGDKAVVGTFFTTRELGWYSAAFTLTLAPAMLVTKFLSSLLLPLVSKFQDNATKFFEHFLITLQTCYVSGLAIGLFFIYFGSVLITTLFGEAYGHAASVVVWLGVMQALRVAKSGPMIVAMSKAETKNALMSNLVRAAFFIALLIAVKWFETKIDLVAILGVIGELFALLMSVYYLKHRLQLYSKDLLKQLVVMLFIMLLGLASTVLISRLEFLTIRLFTALVLFLGLTSFYFFIFLPELKTQVKTVFNFKKY